MVTKPNGTSRDDVKWMTKNNEGRTDESSSLFTGIFHRVVGTKMSTAPSSCRVLLHGEKKV